MKNGLTDASFQRLASLTHKSGQAFSEQLGLDFKESIRVINDLTGKILHATEDDSMNYYETENALDLLMKLVGAARFNFDDAWNESSKETDDQSFLNDI